MILAIETSCDDTCAAVVDGSRVLSSVVSSQASLHERFGGVVPEVASRHHLTLINAVVDQALSDAGVEPPDLDAVAVTQGPGLIGALLVGLSTAKALAASWRLPLIPVDHLLGHVAANHLEPDPLEPPFLCLIASGGHTLLAGVRQAGRYETLGSTLDDAAGEAFDKGSRLLGLGYPGGPAIQGAAAAGDPEAFDFPVAMSRDPGLDFSFSGLKTALLYTTKRLASEGAATQAAAEGTDIGIGEVDRHRADLAASFQRAIVDQLISKLDRALDAGEWPALALGGGVAANSELRRRAGTLCEQHGISLKLVGIELCTDNAAMIASAARWCEPIPYPHYLAFDAFATGEKAPA